MYKSKFIFALIFLTLTFLFIGGCRKAADWLVYEDVPETSDAMVLLMGSYSERVLEAADLYKAGKADRLIIVEESMGEYRQLEKRGIKIISNTSQAKNAALMLGIPADSITILPGDARSTLDEAEAVRHYVNSHSDIDTLLLVSSPMHMRRASIIFKSAFRDSETPVFIGCKPSRYSRFNADRWWRDRENVQAVLYEYIKTGSFLVFERNKLRDRRK